MAVATKWRVKLVEKPLKDRSYFGNLKALVIDRGLCSRCLACMAVCPAAVRRAGVELSEREDVCVDCGACVR
ncbi:MAG: 4Fe-4S dicluster domain-containing protein, partial [Candidatus Alkanophagales archaeon]